MSEVVFSTEVEFDWIDKGKIINLVWARTKISTLGCEDKCVSLAEFGSLMPPRAGVVAFCGSDLLSIGIGTGRKRLLIVHKPCEIRAGGIVLRLPEAPSSLPNLVKIMRVPYALQELGRGARIKVLYGGEPRVYLLITPSQAAIDFKGRCIAVPPEPVLLAAPSGSELEFRGVRLKLP